MMTTDNQVKKAVLDQLKRMVRPGCAVSPAMFKVAYKIIRANAIADTLSWKQKYITIERV